jgi:hypothetical protein
MATNPSLKKRNTEHGKRFLKPVQAWIGISKKQSGVYAELVSATFRLSLGRIDNTHPTGLLDACLAKAPKLTADELRQLMAADKTQRAINRPRGRPRRERTA